MGPAFQHAIKLFLRANGEVVLQCNKSRFAFAITLERTIKLLHLTPVRLPSVDGRINLEEKFKTF